MELTFGIDLGTSRSCICTIYKQLPSMVPVGNSNLLPSCVSFYKDRYVVGDAAKQESVSNNGNYVYATKRLIGRKYSDKEVQEDIKNLTYPIREGMDDSILIDVDYNDCCCTAVDVAKIILMELKKYAEEFARKHVCNVVKNAVICVPAYFSEKQRKDTQIAAERAGFEVLGILNEPTAAAIAYSFDKKEIEKPKKMMVYDLGGGTFDVSIIEVLKGNITVIGSFGNSHLGGEDFTNVLVNYIKEEYEDKYDESIRSKKDKARLRELCENAKINLTEMEEWDIFFKEKNFTISREKYSELIKDLFEQTIDIVNETLENYKVKKEEIEVIILIGGSSKMPQIPAYIRKEFPTSEISKAINADEAVSQGAARYANDLMHDKTLVIQNKESKKISIKRYGDPIEPDEEVKIDFSERKGDLFSSVVMNEVTKELEIIDLRKSNLSSTVNVVVPPVNSITQIIEKVNHSYGVEIQDNPDAPKMMYFMIRCGTNLPASKSKKFESIEDNQESISINIFEGESELTKNNTFLEKITFGPFEKMRAGKYKFVITFDVDRNGNLKVTATHNGIELGVITIPINN